MKKRLASPSLDNPSPPADLRRSRWPVFFCALALLWCAWWYCREDSQGLLHLAAGVSVLALVRPRALPFTARWVIWGGLALAVACLAANVSRLVPPEHALEESRSIERVITVAFALGLTALFFRPSIDLVTLVAVGGLPMAMVVLARNPNLPGAALGREMLIVWGLLGLLVAADLGQRLTRPGQAEAGGVGREEVALRLALLAAVAVLALVLLVPVEWLARGAQRALFGWVLYPDRMLHRRGGDLWLTLPAPPDFGQRMRVVLLVGAEPFPGYLRERVFVSYLGGRWTASKPEEPLKESAEAALPGSRRGYALTPEPVPAGASVWRVEVMAPGLLTGFCLPGRALALACDGSPPLAEACGTLAASGQLPETYDLRVAPGRLLDSAYPHPAGEADPAFLEIPAPLAGAVSNWVAACAGLADEPSLPRAVRRVEEHFATNFTYRLGLRMRAVPDPLVDFMARKQGSCALFASAAALMFRRCGVPSRVVSGFVCASWNPWLKRWTARERDGHAWVEVWDRSAGRWLVADPTPPDGRPESLKKPGPIRLALDWLGASWKRLAGYLRKANFLEVVAEAGETVALFLWQVVMSLPGAVVLAGLGSVWWLRRRSRRRSLSSDARLRAELVRAMERLARRYVTARLRRRPWEAWSVWLRRAGAELAPEQRQALAEWVESYEALRYGAALNPAAAHAWMAAARKAGPSRVRLLAQEAENMGDGPAGRFFPGPRPPA